MVMTTGSEINIKPTTYETPVDDPNGQAILKSFPQPLMNLNTRRQLFPTSSQKSQITGAAAFLTFCLVGLHQRFIIGHTLRHKSVLYQQVVNKKLSFILFDCPVNPQFVFWDVRIPVVLTKVGELLVDVTTDVDAVRNPYF
jgi:hypothetical protein